MGHQLGRCEFLDVLEESAVTAAPVQVELRDGQRFTDVVRDVTTSDGEDFAAFREHGQVPVSQISAAARAVPLQTRH